MAKQANPALSLPKPINTVTLSLLEGDGGPVAVADAKGRVRYLTSVDDHALIGDQALGLLCAEPEKPNGKKARPDQPKRSRVKDDTICDWALARTEPFTALDMREEFGCRMKRVDRLLAGLVGNKEIVGAEINGEMRYTVAKK